MRRYSFLMAGGGTGGHVFPLLAVARLLREKGHEAFFVGTRHGLEARLVPAEGFAVEWIEIGALKRVGLARTARTLYELPREVWRCLRIIRARKPSALFSLGGYVAGPPMLAACLAALPMVLMEPNAMPGFTTRWMGRFARKALLNFQEAQRFFPRGRSELSGLPVREEFFRVPPKPPAGRLTVLITGGSRGARTLNRAARESWKWFRESGPPVCIIHQTGFDAFDEISREFAASGLDGQVVPFLQDMPAAFARADLVVCRSGAGAVAELAAAGKPSLLVPFPFAADDHQLRNAQALERAGAARLVPDAEMNGERLYREIRAWAQAPGELEAMGQAARALARPGAAARAARLLEELAAHTGLPPAAVDKDVKSRNNTI